MNSPARHAGGSGGSGNDPERSGGPDRVARSNQLDRAGGSKRAARMLSAGLAAVSVVALGGALLAQHGFGMQPCPWCIFQRVLYLAIAVLASAGAIGPGRWSVRAGALGALALAAGGVAAAVFQHQVAAKDASCAFTFADRFLSATGLETQLPWLFQVTATCIDAAQARLLGLPFEVWSGVLFALLALGAVGVVAISSMNGVSGTSGVRTPPNAPARRAP